MKKYPYETIVITLTIVLPIIFAIGHSLFITGGFDLTIFTIALAFWTVFWGIGVRLLLAGFSQIARPDFTSRSILGIKSKETRIIVRELGFANVAIGLAGILSLWLTHWSPMVALVGGLFLGLDGIQHLLKQKRTIKENIAMVTDLFVAVVALTFAVLTLAAEVSVRIG